MSTVNLGCKLDLKKIALHARNAEYNPKVYCSSVGTASVQVFHKGYDRDSFQSNIVQKIKEFRFRKINFALTLSVLRPRQVGEEMQSLAIDWGVKRHQYEFQYQLAGH